MKELETLMNQLPGWALGLFQTIAQQKEAGKQRQFTADEAEKDRVIQRDQLANMKQQFEDELALKQREVDNAETAADANIAELNRQKLMQTYAGKFNRLLSDYRSEEYEVGDEGYLTTKDGEIAFTGDVASALESPAFGDVVENVKGQMGDIDEDTFYAMLANPQNLQAFNSIFNTELDRRREGLLGKIGAESSKEFTGGGREALEALLNIQFGYGEDRWAGTTADEWREQFEPIKPKGKYKPNTVSDYLEQDKTKDLYGLFNPYDMDMNY